MGYYIIGIQEKWARLDHGLDVSRLKCAECGETTLIDSSSLDALIDNEGTVLCDMCGLDKISKESKPQVGHVPVSDEQYQKWADELGVSVEIVKRKIADIMSLTPKQLMELNQRVRLAQVLNERGEHAE